MIYYGLSVFVFFLFVAALIGVLLFLFVIIDAIAIWWSERPRLATPQDIYEIPDWQCNRVYPHRTHFWSDGTVGYECPGVK